MAYDGGPRVSIPPTNTSLQHPANRSDDQQPQHTPYAFEVNPPPYASLDFSTAFDNPWPYQPATPDTSIARVRSMMDLSGRSQSFSTPTNGHLAFPEPQLSRSVSHSHTQHASTSRHRTSSNTNDTRLSPTSLTFHPQISTSSFQSTASSYHQDTESLSEVRFRMPIVQTWMCRLSMHPSLSMTMKICPASYQRCRVFYLLLAHWLYSYNLYLPTAWSLRKAFATFNQENCLKMSKSGINWFPNQLETHWESKRSRGNP